jgi:hypothetical protein
MGRSPCTEATSYLSRTHPAQRLEQSGGLEVLSSNLGAPIEGNPRVSGAFGRKSYRRNGQPLPDSCLNGLISAFRSVSRSRAWSPDGTKIAFAGGLDLDTDGEIYVVNLDGTDLTQVTGGSQSPDWGTHPVTP